MISLDRYKAVFSVPGMARTFWISMLGRLPIGITGLAILLLMQGASASFAQGGAGALYQLHVRAHAFAAVGGAVRNR